MHHHIIISYHRMPLSFYCRTLYSLKRFHSLLFSVFRIQSRWLVRKLFIIIPLNWQTVATWIFFHQLIISPPISVPVHLLSSLPRMWPVHCNYRQYFGWLYHVIYLFVLLSICSLCSPLYIFSALISQCQFGGILSFYYNNLMFVHVSDTHAMTGRMQGLEPLV